ncbi:MAG: phage tail protein [Candidatus Gastranaerophilales bacterium]|nr:phage tail protein [Candidatus Gastranaerophilales bacterium]
MGLTEIEYGSLASSKVVNDNFSYLESEIAALSDDMTSKNANYSSQVATLNASVTSLLEYKESFIQTGMILPYTSSTVPDGFLLCDGSEVAVDDYEDLYDVIGTTYGSSDSTTFCLPDLRNRTLWGAGTYSLGDYVESALPNIKGEFRLSGTEGSSAVTGAFTADTKGGSWGKGHDNSKSNPLMVFDASTYNSDTTVYSDDCTIVQPPALAVKFIIKY